MNIASALLKQIVIQQDLDTWAQVKEIYLPNEYRGVFNILEKVLTLSEVKLFHYLEVVISMLFLSKNTQKVQARLTS
jgi:hypothetical protein